MSESSHELNNIDTNGMALVAEIVEDTEQPDILEQLALGGLREINRREDSFNAVTEYCDPRTGNVFVSITPTSSKNYFPPLIFKIPPDKAKDAFIHPHPYAASAGIEHIPLEDLTQIENQPDQQP